MTAHQQQVYIETKVARLDLRVKKLLVRILEEFLAGVQGFKQLFIPTRSKLENAFRLWFISILFLFLASVIAIINR